MGPDERCHPAGDLAHRGQQRKRAVRRPHGLVRDRGIARHQQRLGARTRRGEVEIREEHLSAPRAEKGILLGNRFLDLQDHVRCGPDLRRVVDDRRAGGDEVLVGNRGAGARGMFDQDPVTRCAQFAHTRRSDRDAKLAVLDLPRNPDDHVRTPARTTVRPSSRKSVPPDKLFLASCPLCIRFPSNFRCLSAPTAITGGRGARETRGRVRPATTREGRPAMTSPTPGPAANGLLDAVNKAILEKLQQDGRRTYGSIAEAVGLSEAAVRQRVQKLRDAGIVQIVAVTDPLQVGFRSQAMVGIRVDGDVRRVAERLAAVDKIDYVVMCAAPTTFSWNWCARTRTRFSNC